MIDGRQPQSQLVSIVYVNVYTAYSRLSQYCNESVAPLAPKRASGDAASTLDKCKLLVPKHPIYLPGAHKSQNISHLFYPPGAHKSQKLVLCQRYAAFRVARVHGRNECTAAPQFSANARFSCKVLLLQKRIYLGPVLHFYSFRIAADVGRGH